MRRLAAIDLGSNTIKFTVADVRSPTDLSVVDERAETTRIGEGLEAHGQLQPAAIDRTLAVFTAFVLQARRLGAEQIRCVATAGLRGAQNADVFLHQAREATGVDIEVIDGLREAALAYRAPAQLFGPGPLLVFDVGGRSTEIVVGDGPVMHDRVSLPLGGVRLTERFLPSDPPTAEARATLEAHIDQVLESAPAAPTSATLVGVSGTVLSLAGVHLGLDDMRETVARAATTWLPTDAVESILHALAQQPAAARRRGSVIPEGRADVIVASATIVAAIARRYRSETIRVTHRGVRFGLLIEMVGTD